MGIKTAYKGYKAYSYLEAGTDYPEYEMEDWNWTGGYRIPLDQAGEERVARLVRDNIFIALHEHPTYFPKKIEETRAYNRDGREFCAYEALAASNIDCVFDNMMDGPCHITSKN